jgi:hypothetical protein
VLLTPGAASKVLWQEMLRHELLDASARGAVVIVPVGSTEQHGPHLSLDVDISVPYHLAVPDDRLESLCRDLHATEPPAYRDHGSHCPLSLPL